MGKVLKPTT